uniref:G_PROTEIN_RECEP_F1_2 domain-containing protein n=1 Tax=Steinernema glaseri TaxID=37863 RepID=A0A1I8A158_9BILA
MELFIVRYDEYRSHYNCALKTDEEWWQEGRPNPYFGYYSVTIGAIYLTLYIPFAMRQPDLYKLSCFKLMFFLGVVDCTSVLINCIYSGIMSVTGAVACPHVDFHYIIGAVSIAIYAFQCSMCVTLAINRCVDLWALEAPKAIFTGSRTYAWVAACALYMAAVFWFGRGCEFSSKAYGFFFDPYFDIDVGPIDRDYYEGYLMYVNNMTAIVLLITIYTILFITLRLKISYYGIRMTGLQLQVLLTAASICCLTFVSAAVYIYMQFFYTPLWLIMAAQITWQSSTGKLRLVPHAETDCFMWRRVHLPGYEQHDTTTCQGPDLRFNTEKL